MSPPPPAKRASLSTSRIVFLVIAAAAPLASMIGNLPIALGRGNGAGTPGAFVIAGVTLLCFAVGYAAMSRRIVNTGAFYTYVTEGLGTAAGIGSAYTAVIAYLAFTFGLAAFFGYFTDLVLTQAGVHVPWPDLCRHRHGARRRARLPLDRFLLRHPRRADDRRGRHSRDLRCQRDRRQGRSPPRCRRNR